LTLIMNEPTIEGMDNLKWRNNELVTTIFYY